MSYLLPARDELNSTAEELCYFINSNLKPGTSFKTQAKTTSRSFTDSSLGLRALTPPAADAVPTGFLMRPLIAAHRSILRAAVDAESAMHSGPSSRELAVIGEAAAEAFELLHPASVNNNGTHSEAVPILERMVLALLGLFANPQKVIVDPVVNVVYTPEKLTLTPSSVQSLYWKSMRAHGFYGSGPVLLGLIPAAESSIQFGRTIRSPNATPSILDAAATFVNDGLELQDALATARVFES